MKRNIFLTCAVAVVLLISCNEKHSVSLTGTFENMAGEKLIFEKKYPNQTLFLDSVRLDKNGKFSKRLDVRSIEPAFISIKNDKGSQILMLLAENGEKINVKYARGNYDVEGSQSSQYVKNLDEYLGKTVSKLDSLNKIAASANVSQTVIDSARLAISKTFIEQKRNNIKFIVTYPNSYASIFALYQQLPGGVQIFGTADDFLFYKAVIDSMDTRYANSDYMKLVKRDYAELERVIGINEKLNNEGLREIGFPDIEMPDRKSKAVKLSSLQPNVILVTFWESTMEGSKLDNKELLDIYEKYHDRGFEIYQISLDVDRNKWLRAIDLQKLPWINVCDFAGAASRAVSLYNVQRLPANFIIDKKGEIVARDLFGTELDKKIASLCK